MIHVNIMNNNNDTMHFDTTDHMNNVSVLLLSPNPGEAVSTPSPATALHARGARWGS